MGLTQTEIHYSYKMAPGEINGDLITKTLKEFGQGDPTAESRLIPLIYPELRKLAARLMRSERQEHTLQPTGLVNEAYLRLIGKGHQDWHNRSHFFAACTKVMRHILVDHARRLHAEKRAGMANPVEFMEGLFTVRPNIERIIEVDRMLSRLAQLDPRQSRIVEMRFFGGLTEEEIAAVLGLSVRTVKRDWQMARAWIRRELAISEE